LSRYRHDRTFHKSLSQSRLENVYEPKKRWIENTLLLQGMQKPHVLEVTTPPSSFTALLKDEKTFGEVLLVPEMELASGGWKGKNVDAAILLESLDRVSHPDLLLKNVYESLNKGGIVFVTALVSSGFDMTILGRENAYLYPPDRANCFSLDGLHGMLSKAGFKLLEVSTPGVLDVDVVATHFNHGVLAPLSTFEKNVMEAGSEIKMAFQKFLQQSNMSSFARLVAVK
ncbi:MAG: hypothetical protein Q8P84_00450, partial [Deltaproteobacteria bacterium]|nr:hypothetical protein [Deltaproteobacteria bacterium]